MLTKLSSKELKPNLTFISGKDNDNFSTIFIGTAPSPVGDCFIAWHTDGYNNNDQLICFLAFIEDAKQKQLITAKTDLARLLPACSFQENDKEAKNLISKIFDKPENGQIKLLVKGTEFQEKVWKALAQIDFGAIISYQELAELIGSKNSTRAVASAVAKNNISYLIPCHRIIRKSGYINKYRWGVLCKKKLIDWESEVLK
jgi:AraC family transcriptional regulator of adaptative response/methylated-DNA-[protein]-cysteine methyltransferase